MRSEIRTLLPLAIIPISLVLCCGVPCGLPVALNELQLHRFADGLFNYPLPPNTQVLKRETEVSPSSAGNSCVYTARLSLLSTLSQSEIKAYYEKVWLPGVSDNSPRSENTVFVRIDFSSAQPTNTETPFIATIADIGPDEATFDIRCH